MGLITKAHYQGLFQLKQSKLIVPDIHLVAPRVLTGKDYEEQSGDLVISDGTIYLEEDELGKFTTLSNSLAGIELMAYAKSLQGSFVTETDHEGRLFICGLPKYFKLPFCQGDIIIIDVDGDDVSFCDEEHNKILTCSLSSLRAATPTEFEVSPGVCIEEFAWPTIPGTDIVIAGHGDALRNTQKALQCIEEGSAALYLDMISRLRYIDLISVGEQGKLGEAYPSTRRIGLFMDQMTDPVVEQAVEVLFHEALGHIRLFDQLPSITDHFGHSVRRGRVPLDKITANFWTETETYYDAEIVNEAYAVVQHVESLLILNNNVLPEACRERCLCYIQHAGENLDLLCEDPLESAQMTEPMQQLVSKLELRIADLIVHLSRQ